MFFPRSISSASAGRFHRFVKRIKGLLERWKSSREYRALNELMSTDLKIRVCLSNLVPRRAGHYSSAVRAVFFRGAGEGKVTRRCSNRRVKRVHSENTRIHRQVNLTSERILMILQGISIEKTPRVKCKEIWREKDVVFQQKKKERRTELEYRIWKWKYAKQNIRDFLYFRVFTERI